MVNRKSFVVLIIALCALILGVFAFRGADNKTGNKPEQAQAEEGGAAPDFTVTVNNGSTFTLSDYKDKVVLVNFWATWCPPCVGELPAFEQLKKDNIDGFVFIAINCSEPKSTVDDFIKRNGYTFNVAYDENGDVQRLYPTDGIPYTLIIKNGVIEQTFLGAPRDAYSEYKKAVEECMK